MTGLQPSSAQFRAARALLAWSLVEAARRARISVSGVLRCERPDRGGPIGLAAGSLRDAYASAGIRFHDGGQGVHLA